MEIIDCQVHHPFGIPSWAKGVTRDMENLVGVRITESVMAAAGVDGALCNWTPSGNRMAYTTAPERFRTVTIVDPPEGTLARSFQENGMGFPSDFVLPFVDERHLEDTAADLKESSGLVALRIAMPYSMTHGVDVELLHAGAYDPVFSVADRLGMPVCVWIGGAPGELIRPSALFPDVQFVVDHLGLLPQPLSGLDPLRGVEPLLALADAPNIAVKLTSAPAFSREPYPFNDLLSAIRVVVDAFGPDRVMWGSDYTMHPDYSYSSGLSYLRFSDVLSEPEKELVFGASARRIFHWPKSPIALPTSP